jgi:hypothetical protein
MTREQADEAFDSLSRHARAVAVPAEPAAALALVDKASLAQLQRDAIVHYVSTGPAVVNLAYRVLKAGTATFVAARFAAGGQASPDLFAQRMAALGDGLDGAPARERASALIDRLSDCLAGGRALLVGTDAAPDGVGDLLEAAGIAWVLAQLLEDPPRPALARA